MPARLLSLLLWLAGLASGCDPTPLRPAPSDPPGLEGLHAAATVCADRTSSVETCRLDWLKQNPSQGSRNERLAFCADDACRLHVLSENPVEDLDAALRDCRDFAASLLEACTSDRLDAWAAGQPEQAALGQVAVRTDIDARVLGVTMGTVVRCLPNRSCTGPAAVTASCEATVRLHRHRACPGTSTEHRTDPTRSGPSSAP